jgi:hypothetical protein
MRQRKRHMIKPALPYLVKHAIFLFELVWLFDDQCTVSSLC